MISKPKPHVLSVRLMIHDEAAKEKSQIFIDSTVYLLVTTVVSGLPSNLSILHKNRCLLTSVLNM